MDASSPATALKRFDASQGPRNIGPEDGHYVQLPGVGVRFMLWTEESGGDVSVVEHPIAPRTLCAPLHRHSREDEYSFVLEGRMGAQLGEDVVYAEAGDFVFKPRDQWHTFWNAGDEPCRILEIIAPGGFEHFFVELGAVEGPPTPELVAEMHAKYGIEIDFDTIPGLCEKYGLVFPVPEAM